MWTPLIIAQVLLTLFWVFIVARRWFRQFNSDQTVHWAAPSIQEESVGVSWLQGRRPHMEDTYIASRVNDKTHIFGVFDGHGGGRASAHTANHIQKHILRHDYQNNPVGALQQAFRDLDDEWLNLANKNNWDDGTTAVVALFHNGVVHIANAGDSRAVLARRIPDGPDSMIYDAEPLSEDHKPILHREKERIEKLGGRVVFYGTWRVEGMLAVSRAIGDRKLKKFVSAEPDVRSITISPLDDFIILASDGIWDVMENEQAAQVVHRAKNVREAAQTLTQEAHNRGTMDNMTALVIDLRKFRVKAPMAGNLSPQLSTGSAT